MLGIPKLVLFDLDGVITKKIIIKEGDGLRSKTVLDERALDRMAKLVKWGYKVGFVTGREGYQLFAKEGLPFFEGLAKRGVEGKVGVFAGRGLYRVMPNGEREFSEEARVLMKYRATVAKALKGAIVEFNRRIDSDRSISPKKKETLKIEPGKIPHPEAIQFWYPPRFAYPQSASQKQLDLLQGLLGGALVELNIKMGINLKVIRSVDGITLLPADKRLGAKKAVEHFGLRGKFFLGRAYGDSMEDAAMAGREVGPNMKFVHVKDSATLLRELKALPARFAYQAKPGRLIRAEKYIIKRKFRPVRNGIMQTARAIKSAAKRR